MNSTFPGAVPEIPVSDINKAASYYQNSLGFTVDFNSEQYGIAGISKGDCRMFLSTAAFRLQYGTVGPVLIWLNLNSNAEVDELHDLWSSRKAKIVSAPESKPWNLHEFTVADLDGNLFRVFHDFGSEQAR